MKATILFHRCIQDAQEYGSNDEYMVSRIFFSLQTPTERFDDPCVDIKLTVGDHYEGGSIEVGPPHGYDGPFNYVEFREAVETYYRHLVGSTASFLHTQPSSSGRMRNSIFEVAMAVEINIG